MFKKIILLLFISSLVFSISGCSSSGSPSSSKSISPIEFTLPEYSSTNIEIELDEYDCVIFDLNPFSTSDEDLEIIVSNTSIAECTFYTNGIAGKKLL